MQPFIHLHVHSQYSLLDGQADIKKLVDKAVKDGMPGMALTDHGNMFGIKELANYAKKHNGKVDGKVKDLLRQADEAEAAAMPQRLPTCAPRLRRRNRTTSRRFSAARCMWLTIPSMTATTRPTADAT